MLRECRRVLKPGGRVASVVIEVAPGLGRRERARALELGPSAMTPEGSLEATTTESGLTLVESADWTSELETTLVRLVSELAENEAALRSAEGDDVFDHEVRKKTRLLDGVRAGLLRRTLVVAAAP